MENTSVLKELAKDSNFDLIDIIKQLKNIVRKKKQNRYKERSMIWINILHLEIA